MNKRQALRLLLASTLACGPTLASAQQNQPRQTRPQPARPAPARSETFPSPEAGFQALIEAARADDDSRIIAILGEESRPLIRSGDPADDHAARERFVTAATSKMEILRPSPDVARLQVGNDGWPLPIPMVREGDVWRFDAKQGVQALIDGRIGRNELDTIEVLGAIVDAQHEYAETEGRQGAFQVYARRFFSTPGTHDGLYWATEEGERESPLGPLAAAAASTGVVHSADDRPTPFHGYIYRMLEKQGPGAPGGAIDYVVNGKMIGGFGVIATPAQWGVTGVQTFIVSHAGTVYERNLGPNTSRIAAGITAYDPGQGWQDVDQDETVRAQPGQPSDR
jgi:hypothetical protein